MNKIFYPRLRHPKLATVFDNYELLNKSSEISYDSIQNNLDREANSGKWLHNQHLYSSGAKKCDAFRDRSISVASSSENDYNHGRGNDLLKWWIQHGERGNVNSWNLNSFGMDSVSSTSKENYKVDRNFKIDQTLEFEKTKLSCIRVGDRPISLDSSATEDRHKLDWGADSDKWFHDRYCEVDQTPDFEKKNVNGRKIAGRPISVYSPAKDYNKHKLNRGADSDKWLHDLYCEIEQTPDFAKKNVNGRKVTDRKISVYSPAEDIHKLNRGADYDKWLHGRNGESEQTSDFAKKIFNGSKVADRPISVYSPAEDKHKPECMGNYSDKKEFNCRKVVDPSILLSSSARKDTYKLSGVGNSEYWSHDRCEIDQIPGKKKNINRGKWLHDRYYEIDQTQDFAKKKCYVADCSTPKQNYKLNQTPNSVDLANSRKLNCIGDQHSTPSKSEKEFGTGFDTNKWQLNYYEAEQIPKQDFALKTKQVEVRPKMSSVQNSLLLNPISHTMTKNVSVPHSSSRQAKSTDNRVKNYEKFLYEWMQNNDISTVVNQTPKSSKVQDRLKLLKNTQ